MSTISTTARGTIFYLAMNMQIRKPDSSKWIINYYNSIPAKLKHLHNISSLPQYTHLPLLHIQGIHPHIQKYECFSNKRHRRKHMPAVWSRRSRQHLLDQVHHEVQIIILFKRWTTKVQIKVTWVPCSNSWTFSDIVPCVVRHNNSRKEDGENTAKI